MIGLFERLPSLILQAGTWLLASPMTGMLIAVFGLSAGFIGVTAVYQHRTRRNDQRAQAHRSRPGSFPGDNR